MDREEKINKSKDFALKAPIPFLLIRFLFTMGWIAANPTESVAEIMIELVLYSLWTFVFWFIVGFIIAYLYYNIRYRKR